jgi:hypothetical protein
MDDEKMALFVKRFDKFMVKKGYCARRKKSSSKNKKDSRRCFKCVSKDHLVAQCPYNSDNDDDNKKSKKKDKKKNKEKKDKMTIKKKKGGSYMVTCNSDASSSDNDDSDETRPLRRRVMQALPYKRSLFSLTLHHASWLRPLRYKLVMIDVMRNMIMKVKVKVTMMMNPLNMN